MASNVNDPVMETNISNIPDGYILVIGPNGQRYIVPQFMVPALHQCFDGYRIKNNLEVAGHSGGVSKDLIIVMVSSDTNVYRICAKRL